MAKNKKKDKKRKIGASATTDLEAQLQRLRDENEALRARLEKIAELASELPGAAEQDDEDAEYDEMKRDVDDREPDVNPS
jgi:hypothetical protein